MFDTQDMLAKAIGVHPSKLCRAAKGEGDVADVLVRIEYVYRGCLDLCHAKCKEHLASAKRSRELGISVLLDELTAQWYFHRYCRLIGESERDTEEHWRRMGPKAVGA